MRGAAAQRGVPDALEQLGGVHLARGVPDDLDLRGRRPLPLEHGQERARRGDRAVADRQHLVAAVRAQPRPPVVGDGHPHPGAPAQGPAGQLLDGDLALDPGQAGELLGDDDGLEVALQRPARRAASRSRRTRRAPPTGRAARRGRATRRAPSTASARQNEPPASSVTAARTRSPGSAWRTKTTRPSWRATQWPAVRDGPDVELEQPVGPVGDGRLGGRAHRGRAGVSSGPPAERRDGERPAVAGLGGGAGAASAGTAGPPAPGGGS